MELDSSDIADVRLSGGPPDQASPGPSGRSGRRVARSRAQDHARPRPPVDPQVRPHGRRCRHPQAPHELIAQMLETNTRAFFCLDTLPACLKRCCPASATYVRRWRSDTPGSSFCGCRSATGCPARSSPRSAGRHLSDLHRGWAGSRRSRRQCGRLPPRSGGSLDGSWPHLPHWSPPVSHGSRGHHTGLPPRYAGAERAQGTGHRAYNRQGPGRPGLPVRGD